MLDGSFIFVCQYFNWKEKERIFHGSLGYGDLTFYYLQDLSPTWKKEERRQRESGKAKDQHYVSPPSLTG